MNNIAVKTNTVCKGFGSGESRTQVLKDVVDAQRVALQAERQETQLRGQRAISTVLLVKALGGGWERPTEEAAAR